MGSRGGWGGRGRVWRRFFIEFSLIFIEFPLIFIDFLWFWEAREAGGSLEEAGGSLEESRGAWGWLGARKYWFFTGFYWFFEVFGGGGRRKRKIKVIGTEGVGARPAWGEPGSLGARELGSWGAWRTPEEAVYGLCIVCV